MVGAGDRAKQQERGGPKVTPFLSNDGPKLSIETEDHQRHHRIILPPELRMALIGVLRRVQSGEDKARERPLSATRVSSTSLSGHQDRFIVVQFHERVAGNGVRLHRLPVEDDKVDALIADLWDNGPGATKGRPPTSLDAFLA